MNGMQEFKQKRFGGKEIDDGSQDLTGMVLSSRWLELDR